MSCARLSPALNESSVFADGRLFLRRAGKVERRTGDSTGDAVRGRETQRVHRVLRVAGVLHRRFSAKVILRQVFHALVVALLLQGGGVGGDVVMSQVRVEGMCIPECNKGLVSDVGVLHVPQGDVSVCCFCLEARPEKSECCFSFSVVYECELWTRVLERSAAARPLRRGATCCETVLACDYIVRELSDG